MATDHVEHEHKAVPAQGVTMVICVTELVVVAILKQTTHVHCYSITSNKVYRAHVNQIHVVHNCDKTGYYCPILGLHVPYSNYRVWHTMYISNYGPSTHRQYLFALGRQDPGSKGRHHGGSILLGHLVITLFHSPELFEPAGGAAGQGQQQKWKLLSLPLLGKGELPILYT